MGNSIKYVSKRDIVRSYCIRIFEDRARTRRLTQRITSGILNWEFIFIQLFSMSFQYTSQNALRQIRYITIGNHNYGIVKIVTPSVSHPDFGFLKQNGTSNFSFTSLIFYQNAEKTCATC